MKFPRSAPSWMAGIGLCVALAGCTAGGDSRLEDEKEAHYLTGQNLARQMDYAGAVDAYEQALLINPRNASAHFEAALLCEGKTGDPAAAIYHYERFLKLAPNSGRADVAHAHINACKLELAKGVSTLVPLPASVQSGLEKLAQENLELKTRLAQWEAYYAGRSTATPTNAPAPRVQTNAAPVRLSQAADPGTSGRSAPPPAAGSTADSRTTDSAGFRTHTVQAGDTPVKIARNYNVGVEALMAANPDARAKSLRIGSTLKIPGR